MQALRTGEPAQTITREEFEDILKAVHIRILQMIRDRGMTWTPMYSWDHTNLHENINYGKVGFAAQQRVALGVRAPDMHRVIEHVFGYCKPKLHAELYRLDYQADGKKCQELTKEVFYNNVTANKVQADVAKLPLVYKIISTPEGQSFVYQPNGKMYQGSGGNWVKRAYR